jgi:hypothetical protein
MGGRANTLTPVTHVAAAKSAFKTHPESFIKFIKTNLYTLRPISQAKKSHPADPAVISLVVPTASKDW